MVRHVCLGWHQGGLLSAHSYKLLFMQQFPLGLTFCVWGLPINLSEERLNFFSLHACFYNRILLLPAIGEV